VTSVPPGAPSFSASDNATIAQSSGCGVERWHVKTGTDPDAGKVALTPVPSNIATLGGLTPPVSPPDRRSDQAEFTVFHIQATVTAYKTEADSDLHLALRDDSGHTMIAEVPSPKCLPRASRFYMQIAQARAAWDSRYPESISYRTVNVPVALDGAGFFDRLHGQRGVAPNGIELHPTLRIVL
jgi:hypothetical protein